MNLKLNSTTIYMSVLVVIVIVFGIVYAVLKQPDNEMEVVAAEIETTNIPAEIESVAESVPQKITVHIVGEVVNSDVYTLDVGSRVKDIIDMAGGITEDADIESINLAEYLQDAEQIVIPSKQDYTVETATEFTPIAEAEPEPKQEPAKSIASNTKSTAAAKPAANTPAKININTANATELMKLDGIGEVLAQSIIIYRETNGRFNYIEDIKHVERIGLKTFNKIKEYICVN